MSTKGKAFDWHILRRLFTYIKFHRRNFIFAVCTTITLAAVSPVRPILIEYTFNHFVATPNAQMLFYFTMLLIGLLITESCVQFADTYLTNLLGQNIVKDIRVQLYDHVLGLRLKYFDNTPIGTLVTRAVSDNEVIADMFSDGLITLIGDILKVLVMCVVMFCLNYKLTLVVLIPIPVLLWATYLFKNSVAKSFQEVRTQVANLNAFVQEHITGMSIVQIFAREKAEMKKFEAINAEHRDANIRAIMAYSIFFPVVEILASVSLALLMWWGGREVLSGFTTFGQLLEFILFMNIMFRPIRQLADRFNTLQMGMVSAERVFKVLDTDEVIENKGTQSADTINGDVEFKNVWFAYNDEDFVLRDVSFSVKHGETIALVGATGAGKSSVINLLNRFYEYNKGTITIDGIDLREYELNSLRKNIGVVLQDVFLFSDTIKNNITLNNPDITDVEIIAAAKLVGAYDFIMQLPGGFDYNVMERGATLSVGQRQLISFIRAYVYNPRILVLDEATSSIDTMLEQMIQNAISILTKGRTSIVIAHRLATIQKADRIIVIDKGQVVESGNHQQLLAMNGHYRKLYELQFKGAEVF
jgi:ATP-binding cassette subfamily B protein